MRRTNKNSYLIVDGYNIINAWDGLKEISKEINIDMENATIDISDGNVKINKEKAKNQLTFQNEFIIINERHRDVSTISDELLIQEKYSSG